MKVTHMRSKPSYPDVPCSRLANNTRCEEPSEFMFGDKNTRGKKIIYGMCARHSAENGVRHASPERGSQSHDSVSRN